MQALQGKRRGDPRCVFPAVRIRVERLAPPSDPIQRTLITLKIRPNFSISTGIAMQNYGLAHVWAQGDFVTRGIALALLIMSVMSWSVIVIKAWNVMRLKRLTKNAEQAFWHSDDLADGIKKLGAGSSTPQDNPFLALALSGQEAADHHHQTQPHLHDRMDVSDWVTRCLKDTMDESVTRMQSGLAILASIGSTAPFVGLFGTVWGIYHALL